MGKRTRDKVNGGQSKDKNPLARARKNADLWHRKAGLGFSLFMQYYGGQPLGTVTPANKPLPFQPPFLLRDEESNEKEEVPPQYSLCNTVVKKGSEGSSIDCSKCGMSRASKRRRKKKSSSVEFNQNGNSIASKKNDNISPIDDMKEELCNSTVVNNRKVDSYALNLTTQTLPFSLAGKNDALIQAYQRKNKQFDVLDPFIAALTRPLPLTFRLRQYRHGSLSVQSSDQQFGDLRKRLKFFSNLIKPVQWHENIYQSIDNQLTKSNLSHLSSDLKSILVSGSQDGTISRQELGSMLPVFGLVATDCLRPGHCVLDLCAAPGSKTLQALEATLKKSKRTADGSCKLVGTLVANDIHPERLNTLREAIGRCGLPSRWLEQIVYTNHDAAVYPFSALPKSKKSGERIVPDVVIADVPCSGDGTIRKDSHILPGWTPSTAHALHPLQVKILVRSLELVKVGGVVSYSTCSLNPIENEAVVQAALLQCQGRNDATPIHERNDNDQNEESAVEILEWPCPEGLVLRPGLKTWRVAAYGENISTLQSHDANDDLDDDEKLIWHNTYDDSKDTSKRSNLISTMWPTHSVAVSNPSETRSGGKIDGEASIERMNLDRCRRLLPQDQDTGGFFVAILRKNRAIPSAKKKVRGDLL